MPETQISSALPPGPAGSTGAEPDANGTLQYHNAAGKVLGPAPEPQDSDQEPQADPYAEFGGTTAPAQAKPAAAPQVDPYAEFGGKTAAAQDPYAEFGGQAATPPAAAPKPGFFQRLGESVGLPTSKEGFEQMVKESSKKGMISAATLGPIVDVAPAVWDYAKKVAKNIGGDVKDEYTAASNLAHGRPIDEGIDPARALEGAVSNVPFIGEPIVQAGEDVYNENYAGAAGGLTGAIAQVLIPEAHERIGARLAHARELTAAVEDHKAASAVHTNATNEVNIATTQATEAKRLADEAVKKEAAGQGTRDQTIVAQDNASAASANVMKAQEKLKRAAEAQAQASVKVEKSTNQITKAAKPKGATPEQIAASNKEIMETIPAGPGKSAYTPEDINTVRPYLDNYHMTKAAVNGPEAVYDAMDHAQQQVERDVKPYVEKYEKEPLLLTDDTGTPTSVKQKLVEALADSEAVRPGFTEEALKELDNYNYTTDPSVGEADALRKQLNTDNRKAQNQDRSDVATMRASDPKFAARYELNDILRNGIYDRFEEKGVKGIRGKRTDEAAIIRFRNAADRQIPKAEVKQRGTADVGSARVLAGAAAPNVATGLGIAGGAAIAGPIGAEIGGFGGRYLGKKLARVLSPEDLTRNERITRAMKTTGEGKVPEIDATKAQESNPEAFELPPPATPPVDPHEGTPLHGELATHFGETIGETPYAELERQFREDIATKKKYKVALEPAEKTLLQKLNAQTVQEQLNLKKKPASARPTGTANDRPQVPYVPTEKATTMSAPPKDLGPEWNAGAEAHEQERNKAIVRNPDATPEEKAIAQQRLDDQRARSMDIAKQLAESLKNETPTDNNLHADLATHYNESMENSSAAELENRFMSDLQAKNAQGVELEPAEKSLLQKVNKSKAEARNAQREAATEAAKVKQEAGQITTTRPPFETEPHREVPQVWKEKGITAEMAAIHELGHHFIIAEKGYPIVDMISHEHPNIGKDALAQARWDASSFEGPDGKIDLGKIKNKIEDVLDIFHGGPVAQEVGHGTPIEAKKGAASDLFEMKKWLKKTGFSPIESAQMMKASELRVREALTTPGVPEIMKRYTQLREAGLDPKYLMSQDAIGSAVQEYKNARGGGGNGEGNKSGVSGKSGEGDTAGKPGGTGKVPSGGKKENGPAGEGGTGAGTGRRTRDLNPEMKVGVVEKTTGDETADKAIKAGGGVPGGVMDFGEFGKVKMFHEPETGTTLGFKDNEPITPETVKAKIAKSRAEYGLKTEMAPAATESKTPISDAILDKYPKSDDPSKTGFIFPKGEHVALNPGQEHEMMIRQATGENTGVPNYAAREHLVENENAIRIRARKGPGGDELAFSIPSSGVTEDQITQMRRAVGKQGRYGNVMMETGSGKSLPLKEFARPSDVDAMVRELGAHPEDKRGNGGPGWLNAGWLTKDGTFHDIGTQPHDVAAGYLGLSKPGEEVGNGSSEEAFKNGHVRVLPIGPEGSHLVFEADDTPQARKLIADGIAKNPQMYKTDIELHNPDSYTGTISPEKALRYLKGNSPITSLDNANLKTQMANHDIQGELAKTREESRAERVHGMAGDMIKAFQEPTNQTPAFEQQRASERAAAETRASAQADYDHEKAFAGDVLAGKKSIQDFPHYDSYKKTIDAESKLIPKGSKVLFIGSGPMPLSSILLGEHGFNVDSLELDPATAKLGEQVARQAGMKDGQFLAGDARNFDGYKNYDAVVTALEAGPDAASKNQVLQSIMDKVKPGTKVLARSTAGTGDAFVDVAKNLPKGVESKGSVPTFDGYGQTHVLEHDWAGKAAQTAAEQGGGFTINPSTGEVPKSGYMVEMFPEKRETLDHPATADDIRNFAEKNAGILNSHPELHVGGYNNELNLSGRFTDATAATKAAKKLDQISVWDVAKGEEIPTGGSSSTGPFKDYSTEDRLKDISGVSPASFGRDRLPYDYYQDNWKGQARSAFDDMIADPTEDVLAREDKTVRAYVPDEEPNLKTQMAAKPEDSTTVSPKGSTVGLRDNPLKVKPTGESEKPSTIDVALALNKFTKKSLPALELGKAEPAEMVARAKAIAEDEARYQLAQNNTGESWYTKDMGKHDEILQDMRPELENPAKLSIFKMAESVLSSGQKPYRNFKAAVKAWDLYQETGKFPPINPEIGKSWGPRQVAAYGNAMESINRLIGEHGEQGASDWLLGNHTVRELRAYNDNVAGKADDIQPGVMILGPKRGPFAQNLHGLESAFTADMWVARTWNRWMGTTELDPEGAELATDSPRSGKERKLMEQSFKETAAKLGKSTSSLQAILWYYEQALYDAHGSSKESWNFADAAQRAKDEEDNTFKFGANEPLTNENHKGTMESLSGVKP